MTWLSVGDQVGGATAEGTATADARRRLFYEMGRWLGSYMYGQVRDQLLLL